MSDSDIRDPLYQSALDPADLALVDSICDRFTAESRAGRSPRVEEYLEQAPPSVRSLLLRELLLSELEQRGCSRQQLLLEYLDRCPDDEPLVRDVLDDSERPADTSSNAQGFDWDRDTVQPESTPQAGRSAPQRVGHFELLEKIGQGGMGAVYMARDTRLKRTVAVKMILGGVQGDDVALARFRIEAEAVARLHHPNIVQIYEVGQHDDVPFLSLEYVDGGSLSAYTKRRPQDVRLAANLVEQLARAMHYAHQLGVVHRDLKPSNVLLARQQTVESQSSAITLDERLETINERPASVFQGTNPGAADAWGLICKVTDFGLAKQLDANSEMTRTGTVLGTPSYMAPEQAAGLMDRVGPTADIYSLGAILYELLGGRPPFESDTLLETLRAAKEDEPLSPCRLRASVPRDLETICLKCLEKDAARRYATADELADELRRFQNDEPIRSRPVGGAERLWRWCRRNPVVASLTSAVVVAVLLGLTGVSWKWREAAVANEQLGRETAAAIKARNDAMTAERAANNQRDELQQREAEATFRQGREMAAAGEVVDGLVWMLESLRVAPDERTAEMPAELSQRIVDFRRLVRTNLSAWSGYAPARLLVKDDDTIDAHSQGHYSPDGRWFYLGGADGTVRRIDLETGRLRHVCSLERRTRIYDVAPSLDGTKLVVTQLANSGKPWRSRSHVWDFASKRWQTATDDYLSADYYLSRARFSADGHRLLVYTRVRERQRLLVWDLATSEWIADHALQGHILIDALQPWMIAGNGLLDMDSLAPREGVPTLDDSQTLLDYDPIHEQLLVKSLAENQKSAMIRTMNLNSDERHSEFEVRVPAGLNARFAMHGTQVMGYMHRPLDVRFWEVATGRPTLHIADNVNSIHLDPEGREVFGRDYRTKYRFRLPRTSSRVAEPSMRVFRGGQPETNFYGPMRNLVKHNRVLAISHSLDASPQFWSMASGQPCGPPLYTSYNVIGATISSDGRLAATCGSRRGELIGFVTVWDTATGKQMWEVEFANSVSQLAFSPTGDLLATGDYDNEVRLWDVRTGRQVGAALGHGEIIWSLDFSDNGRLLAVGTSDDRLRNPHVRIWDVANQRDIHGPLTDGKWVDKAQIEWVRFTPGSSKLFAKQSRAGPLRVWDVATGKLLGKLKLEHAIITLAPSGERFAVGLRNGEVGVYDTNSLAPIGHTMSHQRAVFDMEFSQDENLLVVGTEGGDAQLWDLKTFKRLGPPMVQTEPILRVGFNTDRNSYFSIARDSAVRQWPLPRAAEGDLDNLTLRIETLCGRRFSDGSLTPLAPAQWKDRCRQLLNSLGAEFDTADPALHQNGRQFQLGLPIDPHDWHEARARDAEQDGDWSAVRHHLDWAIGAGGNDWQLFARRARAHSAQRRFAAAEKDYATAAGLLQRDSAKDVSQLVEWYKHRILAAKGSNQTVVADWYRRRLAAAEPDEPRWRSD